MTSATCGRRYGDIDKCLRPTPGTCIEGFGNDRPRLACAPFPGFVLHAPCAPALRRAHHPHPPDSDQLYRLSCPGVRPRLDRDTLLLIPSGCGEAQEGRL